MGTGSYSATSKLAHWPLMSGLLYLVQRGGTGRGHSLPRPLRAVSNASVHPSTVNVPIAVLLYNGPLLGGLNVPVKGLRDSNCSHKFVRSTENAQSTDPVAECHLHQSPTTAVTVWACKSQHRNNGCWSVRREVGVGKHQRHMTVILISTYWHCCTSTTAQTTQAEWVSE